MSITKRSADMQAALKSLLKAAPAGLPKKPTVARDGAIAVRIGKGKDDATVEVRRHIARTGFRGEPDYDGVEVRLKDAYGVKIRTLAKRFPFTQAGSLNEHKVWAAVVEFATAYETARKHSDAKKSQRETTHARTADFLRSAGLKTTGRSGVTVEDDHDSNGLVVRKKDRTDFMQVRVQPSTADDRWSIVLAGGQFRKDRLQAILARLDDATNVVVGMSFEAETEGARAAIGELFADGASDVTAEDDGLVNGNGEDDGNES